jgi:Dual specificity phosphatase, catalytic domain
VQLYEIIPNLYQAPTPTDSDFVDGDGKRVEVTALIDLEGDIDPVVPQRELSHVYVYYPIADGPKLDPNVVRHLARFISGLIDAGHKVYVHCKAGMNRASLVTGRVLIHRGMEPEEAIARLRARRDPEVLSNETFLEWLRGEKLGT